MVGIAGIASPGRSRGGGLGDEADGVGWRRVGDVYSWVVALRGGVRIDLSSCCKRGNDLTKDTSS